MLISIYKFPFGKSPSCRLWWWWGYFHYHVSQPGCLAESWILFYRTWAGEIIENSNPLIKQVRGKRWIVGWNGLISREISLTVDKIKWKKSDESHSVYVSTGIELNLASHFLAIRVLVYA